MPPIDPALLAVLRDLSRGLRELKIPFGIVGALVPELLLDARPVRMTNDADAAVIVESLDAFEDLKRQLREYGFEATRRPHEMRHASGGRLDIFPYSDAITLAGRLELEPGFVLNMAGFRHVIPNAVEITVDGIVLPLAPLPLYVLLKLAAFGDRRAGKDLDGVFHCAVHYLDADEERRYGLDHDGAGVPYEYTSAYALGQDARRYLDEDVSRAVAPVLARLGEFHADAVRLLLAERGLRLPGNEQREEVVRTFHWFQAGLALK